MPEDSPSAKNLYQWWWLHDGCWYHEVAQQFGYGAANELNRKAIEQVGARVARTIAKQLPAPARDLEWPEVVAAFWRAARAMWPEEYSQFTCEATGPGEFETNVTHNFALTALERSGVLPHYECPCLRLREGWFHGLGVEATDDHVVQCLAKGGSACTFRARVRGFAPESSEPDRS
jgi:hypothetical protein